MSKSCVLFLISPGTPQEFISQVLSQFDANLSAAIPCCIITPTTSLPNWCGAAESPGPATATEETSNWNTCLAGIKFDDEKIRKGTLDNVGITLHNVLDELPKYNITHAVWITEQIPTAGASLILASGLMRFIKCHHGYLSIVSKNTDTTLSPWIRAMKAAVLLKSDVHKLAKIISKCCWVGDIQFKSFQNGSDVILTGVLVQGKHTDHVTNGNLTTLHVVQMVSSVPLYLLKECVDVTTFKTDTARRLAILTSKGLLCKVSYQKEQGIGLKSEWIRAVQTRSLSATSNIVQGPYVLLWRGKLYTFRDVIHPPADQKGGFINPCNTDWSYERRLLEYFEKAGTSDCSIRVFPVKIPSPKPSPAAANVPHPIDILNMYSPEHYKSQYQDKTDYFDEEEVSKLSYREAAHIQTHGVHYHHNDDENERMQEIQRNYVHRETYCSLSLHNISEALQPPKACKSSAKAPLTRTLSAYSSCDKRNITTPGGGTPLDRTQSLTSLTGTTSAVTLRGNRNCKSTENLSAQGDGNIPCSSTGKQSKQSRSQKNKAMLKSVIAETLAEEGVTSCDGRYKSLSNKLYDICKLLLRDMVSGDDGLRETMLTIVKPQTSMVIMIEKNKASKS